LADFQASTGLRLIFLTFVAKETVKIEAIKKAYSQNFLSDHKEEHLKEDLVDMCNLSKGITSRGEARGIIQTALEFGASESDIVNKLQEKLQVTYQQAQEYFKTYGKRTV
jgi:galactose-1-phosphate uridylyltransferase